MNTETLPGYIFKNEIYRGGRYVVHRAQRTHDNLPVIIKSFAGEHPGPHEIARIKQESRFSDMIKSDGVIKTIELRRHRNNYFLILEDIGGDSLRDVLKNHKFTLKQFLACAMSLARTLGEIQRAKIIHKDIKPGNIILNRNTAAIKFTDFGISTRLNRETASYSATNALEGTLGYMAPEQTGRMNRAVDYRADLYSLGVTFYEVLTGSPPFSANDSMEMVHCHIAVKPEPAAKRNAFVPKILSDIIARLLEKNAEDRYQSAAGLRHDLERCAELLEQNGEIGEFPLGEQDYSGRFQIRQKLYGRADELTKLLDSFERVSAGANELMLVAGYSGVGKTALVNEVHKPITARKGLYIAGKFDQYQRDIPYFALTQAFNDLCSYLVSEDENVLADWRRKILDAVGDQGRVLMEIIPQLELVIGRQPPVKEMSGQEAQNRLLKVFMAFVGAVCRREHPLTVFIDDLQWVDSGSLALLRNLSTNENIKHLLLICAYRDNETSANHPFILARDYIREKGVRVTSIELAPLTRGDTVRLISDSLDCDAGFAEPLAKLVHSKTGGNAFFVNQFMVMLYSRELLNYDFDARKWVWDLDKIQARNVTDNVVELMAGKISRMRETTRKVLQLASSVGNKFDLGLLSVVMEKSPRETLQDIWHAMDEGLLLPLDRNYKLLDSRGDGIAPGEDSSGPGRDEPDVNAGFKFVHDRVQEASYATIPHEERAAIHLKIARLILESAGEEERRERLFDIVAQFEKGKELLQDREEQLRVAELCLKAADKAMKSSAFESALGFSLFSIEHLLNEQDWEENYELTWQTHMNMVYNQFTTMRLDDCEISIPALLERSETQDQKVNVYEVYLQFLFTLNRYHEANQVSREALLYLGIKTPRKPTKAHIALEYVKFRLRLGRRKAHDLMKLPKLEDQRIWNMLRVLYNSMESTYIVAPDSMGYYSMLMANASLKYGNSSRAAFAFGMVQAVMTGVTKEFKSADEFARMCIQLNEEFPDSNVKGRVHFLAGNFSNHWVNPIKDHEPLVQTALQHCQDSGNLNWANYSLLFSRPQSLFFNSRSIKETLQENLNAMDVFLNTSDGDVIRAASYHINWLHRLTGSTKRYRSPKFDVSDEEFAEEMAQPGNFLIRTYYHYLETMWAYMHADYRTALGHMKSAAAIVLETLGNLSDLLVRFYYMLTYLALHRELSPLERLRLYPNYALSRFLLKLYARNNPREFSAYHILALAEEARVHGKTRAADLYHQAIEHAKSTEYHHIQALANELTAKYYLEIGREQIAAMYMNEAHFLYSTWGAAAKSALMEQEHGALLNRMRARARVEKGGLDSVSNTGTLSTVESRSVDGLDFRTVLKVTQVLSGEIKLENLLRKLMKNVMENAGARTGVFILHREGKYYVEAAGRGEDEETITVMMSREINEYRELPISILNFVVRTNEDVILGDAAGRHQFESDAYIQSAKPRSLLCTPILNQGRLIGLLYLENNLTTDAFTRERVQILKVLSSQAAISLENALLYNSMEEKVQERTREVRDIMSNVHQGIFTLNADGTLNPGYSGELTRIFNVVQFQRPTPVSLRELVHHDSLDEYIAMLFSNPRLSRQMTRDLNPLREYHYSDEKHGVEKKLTFRFSPIKSRENNAVEKLMVVVEDKTTEFELQRELERRDEEQRRRFEKFHQVLSLEPGVFANFVREARLNLAEVREALRVHEAGQDVAALDICMREVHTLKGNARALNLESMGRAAHELETLITDLRDASSPAKTKQDAVNEAMNKLEEDLGDGDALFEKITSMRASLTSTNIAPMTELEDLLRGVVEKEARLAGKQAILKVENELKTDLPAELLDKLRNPLMQMARNAVYHGLETERGDKPPAGTITLTFREKDEGLQVSIMDDGKGLNYDAIRKGALERGLLSPEESEQTPDKKLAAFIFHSGMSTADRVTEGAGRGVGMDIVKKDLRKLGAMISIQSEPGLFTRFSIKAPLPGAAKRVS